MRYTILNYTLSKAGHTCIMAWNMSTNMDTCLPWTTQAKCRILGDRSYTCMMSTLGKLSPEPRTCTGSETAGTATWSFCVLQVNSSLEQHRARKHTVKLSAPCAAIVSLSCRTSVAGLNQSDLRLLACLDDCVCCIFRTKGGRVVNLSCYRSPVDSSYDSWQGSVADSEI